MAYSTARELRRRPAQEQVRLPDPAELLADRGRERGRAAAHGEPGCGPGPLRMVHREPRRPPGAGEQRARPHADHRRSTSSARSTSCSSAAASTCARPYSPPLLTALRRLAERGIALGALCTGGYALARAGLLDNYRATIHWENLSALREEFPRVQLSDQVFSIDRDRYTCSGGTAPLDLMLQPDPAQAGPAHLAAGLRAVRARARAQRPRTASTCRCARRSASRTAA